MDFDSYIAKEKQLLSRLERERAEINAQEKKGGQGSLDVAEDEMSLIMAGRYVERKKTEADTALKSIEEKIAALQESEQRLEARNKEFLSRLDDIKVSTDKKYDELLQRVEFEVARLEARNKEFISFIKAQEEIIKARNSELYNKISASEKTLEKRGEAAVEEINQLAISLKQAQKDFEASVNVKLEQDRQTIDKIKYMLSTMSDIIKM